MKMVVEKMTIHPKVSVMMPCYNSVSTLPSALASLVAQTYDNWECLLVDDGSTDNPEQVVEQISDPRVRVIRLEHNMGRGVARQVALDHATGDYLTMLDADDWIYPSKIQRQVEVMESEPQLALVSTGMAIVNAKNEIVGVRARGPAGPQLGIQGPVNKLGMPPVAHAPCMIRMRIAKQAKYDPAFLLGQDVDFLLQVLKDQYYCVLPDVTYAYNEHASVTLEKIIQALNYTQRMFWKYKDRFPIASRTNVCKAVVKMVLYRIMFAIGRGQWMIKRRSQAPTAKDIYDFGRARQAVLVILERHFQQE